MKNYLLTGSSGFLGKIIMDKLPGEIVTLGRAGENDISADLSFPIPVLPAAEVVIHCAGKAHMVPRTPAEKKLFFDVNLKGTRHLLQALNPDKPRQLVFISTVAVYGRETGSGITESHPLQGHTPYAQSKIEAENAVRQWCEENDVKALILRLPLIAGPNPPGNLGKMIDGIKRGRYLSIAGGKAKRSVVLAEDVAEWIVENPGSKGTYNLTDGYNPSFRELEAVIAAQLGKKLPPSLPSLWAKGLGRVGGMIPKSPINKEMIDKMINDLTFDDTRARTILNWDPRKVTEHFTIS